jgi:hypothetical protein
MIRQLPSIAFAAGLATVAWVGAGYVGSHPMALAMTALIAAFYIWGAAELRRYREATDTLAHAVADAQEPAGLAAWIERLHPSLREPVRQRIEEGRASLPGPALTPYLAGLLVLLGMLGTFLGMVVTLRGTGAALDTATDLESVRAALAAPVRGLGLAFGASVAGVATSAMLGLMSSLLRRERLQAVQALDVRIGSTLRGFSRAHQREESFRLLQRQAEALPLVAERLQSLMDSLERQHQALGDRLAGSQDSFHARVEASYTGLAASVDQSLRTSLAESARAAGAAIAPMAESTLAGLAREASALHAGVAQAMQAQLEALSGRFDERVDRVANLWTEALAEQRRTHEVAGTQLGDALGRFTTGFDEGAQALVDRVASRLEQTVERVSTQTDALLARQQQAGDDLTSGAQQALSAATAGFADQAAALLRTVEQAHADLQSRVAEGDQQRLAAWTDALAAMATTLQREWQQAGEHAARQLQAGEQMAADTLQALAAASATFGEQSAALLRTVDEAHERLQASLAGREQQRLAAWSDAIGAQTAALQAEWKQAGEHTARQQQAICDTLAQTARDVTAQAETQARQTLAEIQQLMQAAAEAPRAAASVIGELRQQLSDSMVRDNAMLEERSRILETLATLLDAVNHASGEQRAAIDALVSASSGVLERAGERFAEHAGAETARLQDAATHLGEGAADLTRLGEAFGTAVEQFSQTSQQLGAQLQRIEGALGQSMARSDEQLAYYVAQARDVVDLSLLSQKQIVEQLQQLAAAPSPGAAP